MKLIATILFISICFSACQLTYYAGSEFEDVVLGPDGWDDQFENTDSTFQIQYYEMNEDKKALELASTYVISFEQNHVIKARVSYNHERSHKTSYFIWDVLTERNHDHGYFVDCNKKGKIKGENLDFATIKSTIVGSDSIVDEISWWVIRNRGKLDTTPHFLKRWIYRNDTLIEKWGAHWLSGKNNYTWETQDNYDVAKYSYPALNTITTESFRMKSNKLISQGKNTKVRTYNESGKIILERVESNNSFNERRYISELRYYYRNNKWYKTEVWNDNVLYYLTERKNLAKTEF